MKYLLVSTLLLLCQIASSQEQMREQAIQLSLAKNKIRLSGIPYIKVQVLDNRFNKSSVFIDQTGEYPITIFIANAGKVLENYFDEVLHHFSKKQDTLVINLEELNVPNRILPTERRGKKRTRKSPDSRHCIRLFATCYYKNQNNLYRKVVTIRKNYDTYYPAIPIQKTVEKILNDIIQSATIGLNIDSMPGKTRKRLKHLGNDSTAFNYKSDGTFLTLGKINIPAASKWKRFSIFNQNVIRNGSYRTFEDLKQDSLSKDSFYLLSTTKDSLFKISISRTDSLAEHPLPYAVVNDGEFYIQVLDSFYLPAKRKDYTFYFYVPWTLPDMYALLSLKEVRARNSSGLPPSGNFMANLLGSAGSMIIDGIAKTSEEKKIMREGLKHPFRHCAINMDSGDFIYSNSKPDDNLP